MASASDEIRIKALHAKKTTTADFMVWARMAVERQVRVSPCAFRSNENKESEEQIRERLLAHYPDLIDLAIYAWYELQKPTPPEGTGGESL